MPRLCQAGREPQLEIWGRNLLAGLAWYAGDADRVRALLEPSTGRLEDADRALASRAHVLLANAAHLAGDLAEYHRHGQRAVELARTAAGQEGLALALTVAAAAAISGAGISPSTHAVLDEATAVVMTHADLLPRRSCATGGLGYSPAWASPARPKRKYGSAGP
jgi:hypothetical protein